MTDRHTILEVLSRIRDSEILTEAEESVKVTAEFVMTSLEEQSSQAQPDIEFMTHLAHSMRMYIIPSQFRDLLSAIKSLVRGNVS